MDGGEVVCNLRRWVMKVGMLWFDENREVAIEQRIMQASEYYHLKYGHKPNLCFVHPDAIEVEAQIVEAAMKVKPSQTLLQDHFWIGLDDEN
jgi:hypothetical protein